MANGPSVRLLGECGVTRSFGVVCFLTFQISVSFPPCECIAGARGRHGPDPLGGAAVHPTAIRHPPEPDGGSKQVRHDRGGVGVNSLMQTSEHTSVDACGLGQLSKTYLTQGTASADESSDDLAGRVSRHRVNAKAGACSAFFSRPRHRVDTRLPCTLHGGLRVTR